MHYYSKGLGLLLFLTLSFQLNLLASEVDSFNISPEEIKDSAPILNREVQRLIDHSISTANKNSQKCDKNELYSALKDELGREVISNVEEFSFKSKAIDRNFKHKDDSIYSDLDFTESIILSIYPMAMGATLNLSNNLVGSDKIGHFFSEGFYYFDHYIRKQKTIFDAMKFGSTVYEGYMGVEGTGIYSYGDLAANFHGLRFWGLVLGEFPDPLGEFDIPYISCVGDRWKLTRQFEWQDFVDASWDETRNCSQFNYKIPQGKITGKLSPSEISKCFNEKSSAKLKGRYKKYFTYLVNTKGLTSYNPPTISSWYLTKESVKWGMRVLDWTAIKNLIKNF